MPNELQQARYDQLVRRVGGIIGPGSKVAEALGELFPVVDLERVPGELLALGGTRLGMGSELAGPIAAQLPAVQCFNPANSGFLVTISSVIISSQTTMHFRWNIETTALATLSTNSRFRDARLPATQRPVAEIRSATGVAATTRMGQMQVQANRPQFLNDENGVVVLSPGNGLSVQGGTNNSDLHVSFNWRERVLLPSEENF